MQSVTLRGLLVKACVGCVIVLSASAAGNVNVFERANNEDCEKD